MTGAKDPSGLQPPEKNASPGFIVDYAGNIVYGAPVAPAPTERNQPPWDSRDIRPSPHALGRTIPELVGSLAMTYVDATEATGEDATSPSYHIFYTQAFAGVEAFKTIERLTNSLIVKKLLKQYEKNPPLLPGTVYAGRMKITIIDLAKRLDTPMTIFNDGGILGWALAGAHRVDVRLNVDYVMTEASIDYTVRATYNWHDEFDWNSWQQLYGRQDTLKGKAWALFEGTLDKIGDEALGMSYFLTIYYTSNWVGRLKAPLPEEE